MTAGAIALLAKGVADIGPGAAAAIKDIMNPKDKKNQATKAAKATTDIQKGIDQGKKLAGVLKTHRQLNDEVGGFEDDITNTQLSIYTQNAKSVNADIKRNLSTADQKFQMLQNFPFDDLVEPVQVSKVSIAVGRINRLMGAAKSTGDIDKLLDNLNDIAVETKGILAVTFFASQKVEESLA